MTDTYLAEEILTTLALNRFPAHVLDQYENRTIIWGGPYWMTNCTVQLYVLLPYDYIFEFDIAYYDRYREKLPELNLPPAQYWKGADAQWSLESSMAANEKTPRTEFNNYLCSETWNSTLGMTLAQAGLNVGMGLDLDNRDGNLVKTIEMVGGSNETVVGLTEDQTDNILLVSQYGKLVYDNSGVTYAVQTGKLASLYECTFKTISDVQENADDALSVLQKGEEESESNSLTFSPISDTGVYNVGILERGSSCYGVAVTLATTPLPAVYSVSISLDCGDSKATMFLNAKDDDNKNMLLTGIWAASDGDVLSVSCTV